MRKTYILISCICLLTCCIESYAADNNYNLVNDEHNDTPHDISHELQKVIHGLQENNTDFLAKTISHELSYATQEEEDTSLYHIETLHEHTNEHPTRDIFAQHNQQAAQAAASSSSQTTHDNAYIIQPQYDEKELDRYYYFNLLQQTYICLVQGCSAKHPIENVLRQHTRSHLPHNRGYYQCSHGDCCVLDYASIQAHIIEQNSTTKTKISRPVAPRNTLQPRSQTNKKHKKPTSSKKHKSSSVDNSTQTNIDNTNAHVILPQYTEDELNSYYYFDTDQQTFTCRVQNCHTNNQRHTQIRRHVRTHLPENRGYYRCSQGDCKGLNYARVKSHIEKQHTIKTQPSDSGASQSQTSKKHKQSSSDQ